MNSITDSKSEENSAQKRESNILDRNIAAVHEVRTRSDQTRTKDQELIDRVAVFAGSKRSLYFHMVFYGVWVGYDLFSGQALNGIGQVATLESIFLAIFVLINQKRLNSIERKSFDLHLQMSLLAEHEVTRLTQVTDLIAKHFNVDTSAIKDLEIAKKDVHPTEILNKISEHEREQPTDSTTDEMK